MPKKGKRNIDVEEKTGPRKKKSKVHKWSSDFVPEYASDDEKLYGNSEEPDPDSREYIYDDVDEFHANKEKILLDKGYRHDEEIQQSDEEEVLALDSEESDDEEIRNLKAQLRRVKQLEKKEALGSDLEDQSGDDDDDDGLPDQKAWGSRRSKYYGDDDIDMKDMEEDDAEAVLEEKEALRLQKQMAEQLDDQDFGLDIFQPSEKVKDTSEKEQKIVKDLSKLSKREKIKLLKKESPELITLIEDFKSKMTEVQDKLCPLKDWIDRKDLKGKAVDYVLTKLKLDLNYCTNIVFYLMLKAKQAPVHNHPVIKRLLQYRNIMKQLEPLDEQMKEEIDEIVEKLNNGEDVEFDKNIEKTRTFVRIKEKDRKAHAKKHKEKVVTPGAVKEDSKNEKRYETKGEREALEYYEMMKAGRPELSDEDEEQDRESDKEGEDNNEEQDDGDEDMDGKRGISYQIEKNKGLTAHKKKELRNPRVKHRMKYRKAKIRRKGQYREPRTEMHKYGGEISGIRAGIKRSVKLK
ncbi:something about silencing protein 10-like isoform X2 [Ruditapes philippinarum]|uniref:something about silencing protein 10-like isoform X2 n=1 Tax=Ruditapes philippinarum TaxID=129788 RepID=UPI00295B72C2|nr:something about silencing protein 10-like isoform X2 [Ruditapes philippinarum]